MSTTLESPRSERSDADACRHCGAALGPDHDWCLECGAARTEVRRAPDWRIAAATVAVIVALVLAGFAVALINVSTRADRAAAASAAAASTTPTTTRPVRSTPFPGWGIGRPGYTVALSSGPTYAAALAAAERFKAKGLDVGILDSSMHPAMPPGQWIVFSGKYATRAAAQERATALRARHYRTTVRMIGHPVG